MGYGIMIADFFRLMGIYVAYIAVLAIALMVLWFLINVPDYIFRKLLHVVAFTSILPLLFCTDDWRLAALVEIVFIIIVIIALHLAEHLPIYKKILVEKKDHEIITSFVLLFSLLTILIVVYWGVFGEEYKFIIITSIMAWGPGDAMAAITGKNWGRHKLSGKHIEGVKSVEGSLAMAVTAFIFTLAMLLVFSEIALLPSIVLSLIIAPIASLVELYTKHGLDTVTVPVAVSIVLGIGKLLFFAS